MTPLATGMVFAGFLALAGGVSSREVDLDGNGLADVWEQFYNASGLVAGEDADFDGDTNEKESLTGTDPNDAASRLGIVDLEFSGAAVTVKFPTELGKRYRLNSRPTPDAALAFEEAVLDGEGGVTEVTLDPKPVGRRFFDVTVEDLDTDGDGISDWGELKLDGFDPNVADSKNPGTNDRDTLIAMLSAAAGTVNVTAANAEAFEKGPGGPPSPGTIRISRTGGVAPLTVFYTAAGSTDPEKEPAMPADYAETLPGFVTFSLGQTSVDLPITPVDDGAHEFPNTLVFELQPHPDYTIGTATAELTIFDATDDPANDVLFLGQMSSERGAATSATGVATLFLNGKKEEARVSMSFSGLTSLQIAAHVHHSNLAGDGVTITSGPVVESLELGQIVDHPWTLRRTGAFSPQNLVDALFRQNGEEPLYANAHTSNNPGGEIWGFFERQNGSTDLVIPPDPPAIEPLTGDELRRDVSRFLVQATFGATAATIDALVDSVENVHGGDRVAAYNAWIDAQLALDQTRHYDLTRAMDDEEWADAGTSPLAPTNPQPFHNNRRAAWWPISLHGHDQLRQRVAFALSQIFVVSDLEGTVRGRHHGTAKYYDMLGSHASGNYRNLLEDVSKSPIMGKYLSHLKNQKAVLDGGGNVVISPDENYAREVMQLFSIGLLHRHLDGSIKLGPNGLPLSTYDNNDITELARVFTGWSFSKAVGSQAQGYPTQNNSNFNYGGGPAYFQASWENPMKNFSAYHDTAAKTVLGQGIPAGLNGEQDLDAAMDILFNHPNTGPFVSRLLIQRLVTSNPSAGYLYRVARAFEDNGSGARGDMRAVIKAILLDYEARSLTQIDNIGFGKQKEPLLRYTQLLRAFNAQSQMPMANLVTNWGYPANQMDNFPPGTTELRWWDLTNTFSQSPQSAPTVFNWFLPDYLAGGAIQAAGLVAPEFTITTETQVVKAINYYVSTVYGSNVTSLGLGLRQLPNATDPNLDNVKLDIPPLELVLQGFIDGGDTKEDAVAKLLDYLDFILMAGRLKALYDGAAEPNPRSEILEAVGKTYNPTNLNSRDDAIYMILFLISTTPEYITQK
ncbi:MAG: DUF1800 family protein [Akkermansiaceae bacterium]|nr:DUF1800 family protein [Akkermansiaceae bacterium]MCP5550881.1 DUF1800 family protein [Akkermansiaceae bacterium]